MEYKISETGDNNKVSDFQYAFIAHFANSDPVKMSESRKD